MLEVVFGDSAAGSLRQAFAGEPAAQVSTVLYASLEEERELTPEEAAQLEEKTRRWQQAEEERLRRGWAEGLPIAGSPADIMPLSLALSVGEIAEEGIGPQRQTALEGPSWGPIPASPRR